MEDDIGVTLEDEYDPFVPNDYEALTKSRKEKEGEKKLEERKRSSSERKTLSAFSSYSDSDSEEDEQWKEEKRRESAAMFAPPPTLVESSQPSDDNKDETAPFAVPRPPKFASAVASNIMAKYGWKAGQGLGKTEQGLKTALSVEKTSLRGGKIVNKDSAELMLPPPPPGGAEETNRPKGPAIPAVTTRVVLLKNMVGPGEVDDELQPEVQEECGKYGEVSKCLIFEIPHGVPDEEAVRIFVEFTNNSSATKAYLDLNGRFFGGRIVSAEFYDEDRFAKFDLGP
jgi:splicing factor 45